MKKIVYLVKFETLENPHIPYGLLYIADALEKKGFNTKIFHLKENNIPQLINEIKLEKPIFVGISTLTDRTLLTVLKATKIIQQMNIPVVWGGVHPSIVPEVSLKDVSYVITCEGEETVVEFAEKMLQNMPLDNVKGLGFNLNGNIKINPPRDFINQLDTYNPNFKLLDIKRYFFKMLDKKRVIPLNSSRGCPFRCGFCYNLIFNRNKIRAHSIEFVKNQIDMLKKEYGIDGVFWNDDNFFFNINRAKQIIEYVNLPWFAELRADIINNDFVNWLEKTNCKKILIGAESGSQRILDLLEKKIRVDNLLNAAHQLSKTDISVHFSFIIGIPTETNEELNMTLELITKIRSINPNYECALKIYTPYPGTPLWKLALEKGLVPPSTNEEFAKYDRQKSVLPWGNKKYYENISFVSSYAFQKPSYIIWYPFYLLGKIRFKNKYFGFSIDIFIAKLLRKLLNENKFLVYLKNIIKQI